MLRGAETFIKDTSEATGSQPLEPGREHFNYRIGDKDSFGARSFRRKLIQKGLIAAPAAPIVGAGHCDTGKTIVTPRSRNQRSEHR